MNPATVQTVEYDPYSYELDVDPYPVYSHLMEHEPVYHNERLDFWALTRFDDCLEAFWNWEVFSSAKGTVLELMDKPLPGPLIIFMDPPRQTRLRNLVSKVFTPRRIGALEPAIRKIAAGYLDPLAERRGQGGCDIVKEFTAKLPMDVISTLLGIPAADRDMVRGWSNDLLHRDPGNPMPTKRALVSMSELDAYFSAALEERRRRPREDIMTLLTQAELSEDGQSHRLSDREIKAFFNLLATAGNETVTKLLASIYYWLGKNPDERRLLVEDPQLARGAVEESLRYDPPSQYQGRVLTRDFEMQGRVIPKDARLLIINGASGRDPRKFADPQRFDVRREIDLHLGFGHGRHICLGASLARLESRIAVEEVLARIPSYEIAEGGIERMHSSNVRGFSGLLLEY